MVDHVEEGQAAKCGATKRFRISYQRQVEVFVSAKLE